MVLQNGDIRLLSEYRKEVSETFLKKNQRKPNGNDWHKLLTGRCWKFCEVPKHKLRRDVRDWRFDAALIAFHFSIGRDPMDLPCDEFDTLIESLSILLGNDDPDKIGPGMSVESMRRWVEDGMRKDDKLMAEMPAEVREFMGEKPSAGAWSFPKG